jgi:hypothetical protein
MEKVAKVADFFRCELCDYNTSKKCNLEKHCLTAKHQKRALSEGLGEECDSKSSKPRVFTCEACSKVYQSANGLWVHRKKSCMPISVKPEMVTETPKPTPVGINSGSNENNDKEFLIKLVDLNSTLITQNQEFQKMLLEQNKQIIELSNKSSNIINNNNCNNRFNINVFLNEKCKDAINITDFVNSLQLSVQDLENVGQHGFIDGISKIFLNGLKQLDIYKRPIHCCDLKREIMYIKDQDTWEKDDGEKQKMKSAIKTVSHRNIQNIPEWKKLHPQCSDGESKKNDEYLHIVSNSMGAYTQQEDDDNYNKIVKKIAKEVVIDKT